MELSAFKSDILSLGGAGIIEYIRSNRLEIKLLFIKADKDQETVSEMGEILNYLAQLDLSRDNTDTDEIQFLYLELGLYFKMSDKLSFVSTCFNKIDSNVLKYRLNAWISYQSYTSLQSHVTRLSNYLSILSQAITDGETTYENEVIRDLHHYVLETNQVLLDFRKESLAEEFMAAINSDELAAEFPILTFYNDNKQQFDLENEIIPYVAKVFEPTLFSQELFTSKFMRYIRTHPKTVWSEILIGKTFNEIRTRIIGKGQTDYDKVVPGLEPLDIVKLYAYCNMRMHFFTSLYLFERLETFLTLYNSPGRVKFIDIGCGPATAGLSFIEYLHENIQGEISFDYIGVDCYQNMLDGARYFLDNAVFRPAQEPVLIKDLADLDYRHLDHANSILINTSYLFASDNLDPEKLADAVMNVRRVQPTVPCYLLFQNSVLEGNNIKYLAFKDKIGKFQVLDTCNRDIYYSTQRFSPANSTTVYFEILLIE